MTFEPIKGKADKSKGSKPDLVLHWQEKIKSGKVHRKEVSSSKNWSDYRQKYRGRWADELYPVNRIFSYGRSLIPQVYFQAPYVTVTATRPEMEGHAKVVEALDNWLIRETLLKATLKKSSLDSYLCGTGPIKIGYDSEFGYNPVQAVDQNTSTVTQVGTKESRLIEYKSNVKPGMPWALPVLPEDVVVPIGYQAPSSLPWVAQRILRPLADVKQDQKYKNTDKLEGTRLVSLEDEVKKKNLFKEAGNIPYAELWEVRDASTRMVHVFCEDQILLSTVDELQLDGLPWEFIIFNEDPEYFWGISDVDVIMPQQMELNEIRTQSSRHRKIALLKFLAQKGAMGEFDLDKFLSGEVGPFIEIDAESIASSIQMLQPHVPPELSALAREVQQDMREGMGFSENELGAFSPYHGKTATETERVGQSHDSRVAERKGVVADCLVNIIRKWNQMLFKFWTSERVVQVAGPEGGMHWIQYTGDQLAGEYNLKVDPESGFPVSKAMRTQIADGLMKQYGGDPLINQNELRKRHLEQFEWIFPGIKQLLVQNVDPATAAAVSDVRQPSPMGGSGMGATGNRGGGATGATKEKPMNFQQGVKKVGG